MNILPFQVQFGRVWVMVAGCMSRVGVSMSREGQMILREIQVRVRGN